jgi:fluoride exporter
MREGAVPEGSLSLVRSRWDILIVVAVGGALGSLARWGIGHLIPWSVDRFPWATFVENVSGSLALGTLMVLVLDVWPPSRYVRPFLGVGVLGGYTTFSTYALETRDLLAAGHPATAMAYLLASLVGGLLAVWLGMGSVRLALRIARRGNAGAAG